MSAFSEGRFVSRTLRLLAHLIVDALILSGSLLLALALRFDGMVPPLIWNNAWNVLPYYVVGSLFVFRLAGLYRGLWRYASVEELGRIGVAVVSSAAWLTALLYIPFASTFPRSALVITAMLVGLGIGASRISARVVRDLLTKRETPPSDSSTLIIGAGDAGAMLLREFIKHGKRPIGFIDDDPLKRGQRIQGVEVIGDRTELRKIIEEHQVTDVVIAMPSVSREVIRETYEQLRDIPGVCIRTVPTLFDIGTGKVEIGQPRPVDLADLLGRDPVQIDLNQVRSLLRGRRVLVTGAGGSIGSELCRQIAAFKPAELMLLDHDENGMFHIQNELKTTASSVPLHSVITDIRDRLKLQHVFESYKPEVVFHAAAHKHVPFMEENPEEAVKTNIFGTRNVAELAWKYHTERFVLISTDKAVNPTSVMGATKRVAELIIQDFNSRGSTRFMSVRFGNVLGSSGSVVPLFQKQIADGGPVTVTDPEMTRYFMTIPEAVQLVLQASALGQGGEVFVLDMGEPVKIMDLAKTLIRLSGLEPGRDIDIKITGRRPGEKLYEEVLTAEEGTEATRFDRIYSARVATTDTEGLRRRLDDLAEMTFSGQFHGIVDKLVELVPTYEPETYRRSVDTAEAFEEVAATGQKGLVERWEFPH